MVAEDSPEVLARFHAELRLVPIIARQIRAQIGEVLELDEMISFGQEGLLEAARRFDPDRGVSFRRWANFRVRGAILDGVRSHARLPRRAWEKVRALRAAINVGTGLQEDAAAAVSAGVRGQQADDLLSQHLASMATAMALRLIADPACGEDGEPIAADPTRDPEDQAVHEELVRLVHAELSRLPETEATLVRRHFLRGEDIDDVSRELGLSKSWGSRLLARGIGTLSRRMQDACA